MMVKKKYNFIMKTTKHDKATLDIQLHPSKIDMEGRTIMAREVAFFNGKKLEALVDIIAFRSGEGILIGEYKCTHSLKNMGRAIEQLHKAKDYLSRGNFSFDPVKKLYLPGDQKYRMLS
jgi:hypothetical protein